MRAAKAADDTGMLGAIEYTGMDSEQLKQIGKTQQSRTLDSYSVLDVLGAPVAGKLINISDVKDKAFKNKVFGEGAAIVPNVEGNKTADILAPIDGVVKSISRHKNSYTLVSDHGAGLMLVVGNENQKYVGTYFASKVKTDQKVKKGDVLGTVNFGDLKEKKYDTTVTMCVVNTRTMKSVTPIDLGKEVKPGDDVVKIEARDTSKEK